jgi:hypothetical protein
LRLIHILVPQIQLYMEPQIPWVVCSISVIHTHIYTHTTMASRRPNLFSAASIAKLDADSIHVYNKAIETNPKTRDQSAAALLKTKELRWTHGDFISGDTFKRVLYLAWYDKATGERDDEHDDSKGGAPMITMILPHHQVGWYAQDPTRMNKYAVSEGKQPNQSFSFLPKKSDAYNVEANAECDEILDYLDDLLDRQRIEYIGDHARDLSQYIPEDLRKESKFAPELVKQGLRRIQASENDNFLTQKSFRKTVSAPYITPDWTRRKLKKEGQRPLQLCMTRLDALERFFAGHKDKAYAATEMLIVKDWRRRITESMEDPTKLLLTTPVHHSDYKGDAMSHVSMLRYFHPGTAFGSARITIKGIRISTMKDTGRKFVVQDLNFTGLNWLTNGVPYVGRDEVGLDYSAAAAGDDVSKETALKIASFEMDKAASGDESDEDGLTEAELNAAAKAAEDADLKLKEEAAKASLERERLTAVVAAATAAAAVGGNAPPPQASVAPVTTTTNGADDAPPSYPDIADGMGELPPYEEDEDDVIPPASPVVADDSPAKRKATNTTTVPGAPKRRRTKPSATSGLKKLKHKLAQKQKASKIITPEMVDDDDMIDEDV